MSEHIVSTKLYYAIWIALLVLTGVTAGVAFIDLGPFNTIVALTIATLKAVLVVLFFMHLKYDKPFNGLILIVSLALVALFIVIALGDTQHYQKNVIPGYAPEIKANTQ
jgi:cytochrome c oxidase subunit 4